jgi:UDP-glucose 6-dehydrogenase
VALINAGKRPVVERGVDQMIAQVVAESRLGATTDPRTAIGASELVLA